MTRITDLRTVDVRFPTSAHLDGSDAMNPDPDYSAAYVILETDQPGLEGHGLTFTIGRGNDLCCRAIEAMRHRRHRWLGVMSHPEREGGDDPSIGRLVIELLGGAHSGERLP